MKVRTATKIAARLAVKALAVAAESGWIVF